MKSFKEFLSESVSEGIYGEMHRSILDRIVSHMQENHPNLPISKENIKNGRIKADWSKWIDEEDE
jgi:predicted small metal-binding protein